ncbi:MULTISPECIES: TetR/AcrR family transcriptional regulator [Embleya]|uniref:TetR family transcriptional regulator n=2 Tax=Embleya TaxID=2699295 RepID=A0A1T3NYZ9_9ACTN|nr:MULTISPECIES: TetR family transcriptional regulator [Embleya]OPC82067.1 TetR family transcriptional regulator [Embleya scabrispora]GCD98309.1 HTH-type transcriptional repressor [Embleya hyalina]
MPPDTARTRAKLLDAARAEFAEHGIAGARVDRIALRAGVNKERIYAYFGNKEQLFQHVLTESLQELNTVVTMPNDDPAEYIAQVYDFYCARPELLRLLVWEALYYGHDPVPDEERRVTSYAAKLQEFADHLGVKPSPDVAQLLYSLIGVAAWQQTMPQMSRVLLGADSESEEARANRRKHLIEFTRASIASMKQS